MKEDYLWDKTGEVDEEIAELENMLGRLRYKRPAQPLPLPAITHSWFRLNTAALAIAASLVLLLLAGGLWLKLSRPGSAIGTIASGPPPATGPVNPTGETMATKANQQTFVEDNLPPKKVDETAPSRVMRNKFVMVKYRETQRTRELRQAQLRRGEIAKEQLLKALFITSEKLNVAQKKIQGTLVSGPIS